jgi:predicted phage terminase large subunit-like protein
MANSTTKLMNQEDVLRLAREAKAEKARRELARRHLLHFGEYVYGWFEAAPHLEVVAEALLEVYRYIESGGEEGNGRLMVFLPPQTGKSTLVSMIFPGWLLGRRPNTKIALTSYVSGLAERNSRNVRAIIESGEYANVFGSKSVVEDVVALSKDSRSVSDWLLGAPHTGGVIARGVGGGLTGHALDLIVIDDPFRDRKDADSDSRREDVENWYQSAVYTRARKGTAIVVMHTRWHEDDLAGRLMKRMVQDEHADQYKIVVLPAQALPPAPFDSAQGKGLQTEDSEDEEAGTSSTATDEMRYASDETEQRRWMEKGVFLPMVDPLGRQAGESVWEKEYPSSSMAKRRANATESEWWPVYQQIPRSKEGQMFNRDNVRLVKALPNTCEHFVRYWDKAGTEGGGARSAGVLMTKSAEGQYIVCHVEKGQWSSGKRNRRMEDMAQRDAATHGNEHVEIWVEQEGGSGGKESAEFSVKLLAGHRVKKETAVGSKELRAEPFADQVEAGNVALLVGDWNEEYLRELESFPQGKYKDQVDASSGAFNKLALRKVKKKQEAGSYQG